MQKAQDKTISWHEHKCSSKAKKKKDHHYTSRGLQTQTFRVLNKTNTESVIGGVKISGSKEREKEEEKNMMKFNFPPCSPDKRQEAELSSRP